jgi:uncharacterized membrane protein
MGNVVLIITLLGPLSANFSTSVAYFQNMKSCEAAITAQINASKLVKVVSATCTHTRTGGE